MTAPLSPVEALQREIDSNLLLPHQTRRPQRVLCALLELAKADAEMQDHIPFTPDHAPSTCAKCLFHGVRVSAARAKLNEVLQK